MSRLVVFVETSQTLPVILFFTAISYKQNRIVAINETQPRISRLQVERARIKMLCAVDYIFNLLCTFNCLQPMKKFVFSVASRATGRLQIKPSGSGDENGRVAIACACLDCMVCGPLAPPTPLEQLSSHGLSLLPYGVSRCFDTVFQRPYRYFSIALKVVSSLSDHYKIFTSNWLWIEICEHLVLSKTDITMTTINKKL